MSRRIEKKAWPEWFQFVWDGVKTYEYRLADFDIDTGDIFVMQEWDPQTKQYSDRTIEAEVGHIGYLQSRRWDTPDDTDIYAHYILSLLNLKRG